jgi:hypothetical protein
MTADPSQLEDIARTLGFSLDELALNRLGQLSAHQGWEIVRQALAFTGGALMGIGAILVVVFLVKPVGLWRLCYVLLVAGAVLMIVIGSQSIVAAWQHKVVSAEGALDVQVFGRGGPIMFVGRAHIPAPTGAASVLTKGENYRLHYIQGLDQFLSIEPVSKAP